MNVTSRYMLYGFCGKSGELGTTVDSTLSCSGEYSSSQASQAQKKLGVGRELQISSSALQAAQGRSRYLQRWARNCLPKAGRRPPAPSSSEVQRGGEG